MLPPADDAQPLASPASQPDPIVVGIGASAGGLGALKIFFSQVPRDTGLAFVVVVHLAPDHESHLANILQPHARIPVQQVTETVSLEANHIYLIPPNANLDAIDTHLRLSKLEARRQERAPVDHFFRTLARAHGANAVGVILSGTGTDGALGVKEIKEKGGLAIAQSPTEAEYEGMPQSAIATGMVDLVLPLAQIPAALLRFARTQPRVEVIDDDDELAPETRQILLKIFSQIRACTGRDCSRYKRSTLLRRISRRMQLRQFEELSDYLELLRAEPEEVHTLADDILITVTNFFRDRPIFDLLAEKAIPAIFAQKTGRDDSVRVWVVGCATGEEAYSLAMLLAEEAQRRAIPPRIQIFASDLHDGSLERARRGCYPGDIGADVSPERLRRFFVKDDGGYRVREEIREMIVFAPHNLLNDPPFSRLDLISCRNLLIYLQRDAQDEVAEIFHYALRPDGFLVVGTSESITHGELFATEDKKSCMYRKRDVPTPEPRLPIAPRWRSQVARVHPLEPADRHLSYGGLHQRIVERHLPPNVLVGPDDTVVHLSEEAGRYLVHPGGELTASVFTLVREELRVDLRAALSDARRGRATRSRAIRVRFNGEWGRVVLHVRPSREPDEDGFVVVVFDEFDTAAGPPPPVAHDETAARETSTGHERERELESEIEQTRHRLQVIVEEYEASQEEMRASNEELQSANEELRSTLEELETSKEELHSMNEELQTVNQENRHKMEELAQLSGDLQNLLVATDIATLFLDRELRIMRFTPKVGELFNVRGADRGRPLADLTNRLGYDEILTDAEAVLARLVPIEREVRHENGSWYLTHVLPYRSTTDRIDGVVITFVDITMRKRAEEMLRLSEEHVSDELRTMLDLHQRVDRLLVSPDLAGVLEEVLVATIGLTGADLGSVHLLDRATQEFRIVAQRGLQGDVLARFYTARVGDGSAAGRALEQRERVVIEDVEFDPDFAPHRDLVASSRSRGVQSTPLLSRSGEMLGILTTHYANRYHPTERDLRVLDLYARQATDFIERAQISQALREKTRELEEEGARKQFFLAALGHELRNPLSALDNSMRALEERAADPAELHPVMAEQIRHIGMLIEDLLEISRIDRGAISLRKSRVDIAGVIHAAAASVAQSVRAKRQALSLPPREPVHIHADEVRMEQVMMNLLTNASRFTEPEGRIDVTLARMNGHVSIAVRDEGRGLERDDLAKIFEPFAQIDPTSGGLGIGLALVNRLVDLHNGSIEVASDGAGTGSVFTVRLPVGDLGDATPAGARIRATRRPAFPAATRVLVVDDFEDNANSLALLLRIHGAEVRCAYSGEAAIAEASDFRPQVALVDIGLPDTTGYDVAQRIRAQTGGAGVLLLAVTGFGGPQTEEKALKAGFDARLLKPLDHDRLHALIVQHMEGNAPTGPGGAA